MSKEIILRIMDCKWCGCERVFHLFRPMPNGVWFRDNSGHVQWLDAVHWVDA